MEADTLIESIVRTFTFMAGILGNSWLALVSLPKQRSDVRTNEVLFINLAVSDLITNYLVDLPDTAVHFAGRWFLGETFCGIFLFCADLSETSSIYTTLFISAFWHQKLVGSLKRGGAPVQLDSLRLVGCLLVGSWMLATIFSIPHYFFASVKRLNESHGGCVEVFPEALSKQTYEITFLVVANVFPLVGIIIASAQIVVTLLRNQRHVASRESASSKTDPRVQPKQTPPKPSRSPQARAAKSVVAVASVVVLCWLTHLLLRLSSSIHTSSVVLEVAGYIASSYTSIIPYIFLHGVKKLSCSCKKK
ncbi:bombesin receptor subtype-3 [Austrofundulus limnaeus]|uniref:Bombesin receptor subtype-3 n=1 Tax=Austrofundulus limnaeus TaxID=52670 RepID=A0A2I4AUF2_AUSLI|nr:PREDICTED: bombesin receptor subtype-3-like [Austrofundulus limnaeus]